MLRALFAQRQILQRVDRGDIRREGQLKRPLGTAMRRVWPPRTMTRMTIYRDLSTGARLCETHQFECVHGFILASGFPDPKVFWEPGETLVADSEHLDDRRYECSPHCTVDRARTETARRSELAQYRQECALCEAWMAAHRT
jgi:hypothetical protein